VSRQFDLGRAIPWAVLSSLGWVVAVAFQTIVAIGVVQRELLCSPRDEGLLGTMAVLGVLVVVLSGTSQASVSRARDRRLHLATSASLISLFALGLVAATAVAGTLGFVMLGEVGADGAVSLELPSTSSLLLAAIVGPSAIALLLTICGAAAGAVARPRRKPLLVVGWVCASLATVALVIGIGVGC